MGKVSVSLILPEIFQCRVLSAWQTLRYVDIIKGNKLFNKLCLRTQAFTNINFIVNDHCLLQHNFRRLLSGNCFLFLQGKR